MKHRACDPRRRSRLLSPSCKRGLKRLRDRKSAPLDLLLLAHERGTLTDKDLSFYQDVRLKRKLSMKQMDYRTTLDRHILASFDAEARVCGQCHMEVYAKVSKQENLYWRCTLCETFVGTRPPSGAL